jgi:hypothetical protein
MNKFVTYIKITLLILFTISIFIFFIGDCCEKNLSILENFTPQDVYNIVQSPGSTPIGTTDQKYLEQIKIETVSNGYNDKIMNNLQPSIPEPTYNLNTDIESPEAGNYPHDLTYNNNYPITEFQYPNDYKFTVKYPCRPSATGMFTDCGTWSANLAWTANPYKGLNCKICTDKKKLDLS